MSQKGFVPILIIILIAALVGGYFVYQKQPKPNPPIKACTQDSKQCWDGSYVSRVSPNCDFAPCPSPKESTDSAIISNWKTYTNEKFVYEFKYSASEYEVKEDDILSYSKRFNFTPNLAESFYRVNKYAPPKILDAKYLESLQSFTGQYSPFKVYPFSIWIFENLNQISIEEWYKKYDYYPFASGDAVEEIVEKESPKKDIIVGGKPAKFSIDYGYGTKFYYISFDKKMYLIYTHETPQSKNIGYQILSTFRFLP